MEILPYLRILTSFPIAAHLRPLLPLKWARVWQGTLSVEPERTDAVEGLSEDFAGTPGAYDAIEESDRDL